MSQFLQGCTWFYSGDVLPVQLSLALLQYMMALSTSVFTAVWWWRDPFSLVSVCLQRAQSLAGGRPCLLCGLRADRWDPMNCSCRKDVLTVCHEGSHNEDLRLAKSLSSFTGCFYVIIFTVLFSEVLFYLVLSIYLFVLHLIVLSCWIQLTDC